MSGPRGAYARSMGGCICRLSTLRRMQPRRPDGRRVPGWRRADLVMSLVDGRITGVMVGRRLTPWETLSDAVVAGLAVPSPATATLPTWSRTPAALGIGQGPAHADVAADTPADPPLPM